MNARELALERLYKAVGECMRIDQFHIPVAIAAAYLTVRQLTPLPDKCMVCQDGVPITSP